MKIQEIIRKVKDGYRLYSKDGKKNLGTYPTRAGAEKRERQVQYFKHRNESVDFCVNCGGLVFAESLNENLKKWFKDKWVRFGPDGKIRGDCARGSSKEGKPKCLPRSKANALGKKGRKSAASRKRREDPSKNRRGKAINVKTKKKK